MAIVIPTGGPLEDYLEVPECLKGRIQVSEPNKENKGDPELDAIRAVEGCVSDLHILRRLRVLNFCAQRVADEIAVQQAAQQAAAAGQQAAPKPR